MTDDIHSLARRLEALDEQSDAINADKASVWADAKKLLRDDLPAFRDAIGQRRKRAKNPAAYDSLKGRSAEYLDALDNGVVLEHTRAPARARGGPAPGAVITLGRTLTYAEPNSPTPPPSPPAARGPDPVPSGTSATTSPREDRDSADGEDPWLTAADLRARLPEAAEEITPAPYCANDLAAKQPPEEITLSATPDPDAGWQARDGHDSYVLALQVGNGKVEHPAGPDAELVTPAFLKRGSPESDAVLKGAAT